MKDEGGNREFEASLKTRGSSGSGMDVCFLAADYFIMRVPLMPVPGGDGGFEVSVPGYYIFFEFLWAVMGLISGFLQMPVFFVLQAVGLVGYFLLLNLGSAVFWGVGVPKLWEYLHTRAVKLPKVERFGLPIGGAWFCGFDGIEFV
jgi:hypothetical protein